MIVDMGTYCLEHSHYEYVHHSKIGKGTTFWSLKFFRFCNPHINYSHPYILSLNNLLFFFFLFGLCSRGGNYAVCKSLCFARLCADHVLMILREISFGHKSQWIHTQTKVKVHLEGISQKALLADSYLFYPGGFGSEILCRTCWFVLLGWHL